VTTILQKEIFFYHITRPNLRYLWSKFASSLSGSLLHTTKHV